LGADADGIGLGSNTNVGYIDIAVSRGEIATGKTAQCDVPDAGCVIQQRTITVARVFVAGRVLIDRKITSSRVLIAGCVEKHRAVTLGRILVAGCVENERETPGSGVVVARAVEDERVMTIRRV